MDKFFGNLHAVLGAGLVLAIILMLGLNGQNFEDGIAAAKERGANGVVVTWRIFGSSGIRDWSRAPITDQFTRAAPEFWNKGWGTKTMLKFDPKYLRLGMHRPIIKSQHKDTDYPASVLWVFTVEPVRVRSPPLNVTAPV